MLKKIVALLLSILLLIGLIGCSAGAQELKQIGTDCETGTESSC